MSTIDTLKQRDNPLTVVDIQRSLDAPQPIFRNEIDPDISGRAIHVQGLIVNDTHFMESEFGQQVRGWLELPDQYQPDLPILGNKLHTLCIGSSNGMEFGRIVDNEHCDIQARHGLVRVYNLTEQHLRAYDETEPEGWWREYRYEVDPASDQFIHNTERSRQILTSGVILRRQLAALSEQFSVESPIELVADILHNEYVRGLQNSIIKQLSDPNHYPNNIVADIQAIVLAEQAGPRYPKPTDAAIAEWNFQPRDFIGIMNAIDKIKYRLFFDEKLSANLAKTARKYATVLPTDNRDYAEAA